MRRFLGFMLMLFLSIRTFSQIITVNAGADTSICLGTSATLTAGVPSFTFHQTTDYLIQTTAFSPEPYAGTNAGIGTDDLCYGPFAIGFTFCFYGNSYTNFWIGANGWVGFSGAPGTGGSGYDPWVTTTVPNSGTGTPKNCIMGPWRDWHPGAGPSPGQYVKYTTTGTAPNRKCVVTYHSIPLFNCTGTYSTFQIVLHETTNIIDNHLINVNVCSQWNSGNGTQAVHNQTGTQAKVVTGRNCTPFSASSETKQFVPNGPIITNSVSWYALPNTTNAIGTGNTITVSPSSPSGVYPYSVTYQAKVVVCTSITDNVVVTVNPCGYLDGITDNVDCYGASTGSASVYIYDGIPPYTYSWSNGVILSNTNDNSSTITNLNAGNYTVTVSMFNGAYTLDTTFTITQNPQMSVAQLGTTPEACAAANNGTLTVEVTNGTPTYFYSIGNFTGASNETSYQFTGLDAGSYMVTVADTYGCLTMDNFTVDVLPQMTLNISPVSATCPGAPDGAIIVNVNNGTPDYTYFCTFSLQQPTISNSSYTFTGIQGGNYNINVVDANGCVAGGVTVVGELQITSTADVDDVTCYAGHNGSASVQIAGGTQPYSYLWSTGGAGPSVNLLYAGYYACSVTDAHDCVIVVPVIIEQPDSIVISSSVDTTMCLTETATISSFATGGTSPYTFIWNNGQNGQSIQVSPTSTTSYFAHAVDANGCLSINSEVTVSIFPPVTIYLYTYIDSLCAGDSTAIFANFDGGNGGPYNCFVNDSLVALPYYVHPQVTTTFTLTGKDTCGSPSGSNSIIIYIMNAPGSNVQAIPTDGCAPMTVTFIDPSPDEGQIYVWDFEDLVENGYSVARNPVYTYDHPGLYDVTLTTKSTFGCYSTVIYTDFINVKSMPVASFIAEPFTASIFKPEIYFHNYSTDNFLNTWIFGDGYSAALSDVQHTYQDTGRFPVLLIVQNVEGCVDTLIKYIEITPEYTLWAPNAFSPHSINGENTTFMPVGAGIDPDNFHLIVYDRWGGKAFESFDMHHGWNGKLISGDYAKSGTYNWVVIYKDYSGKTNQKSGSVTLID